MHVDKISLSGNSTKPTAAVDVFKTNSSRVLPVVHLEQSNNLTDSNELLWLVLASRRHTGPLGA